jgi:hypothetical protein
MTVLMRPGLVFVIAGIAGSIVAARHHLLLGGACFFVTMMVQSVDGMRGILQSYRPGPADADDPESPVVAARIGRRFVLVLITLLITMSLGLGLTAARSVAWSPRIISTAFAIAALAGGLLTSVRRRAALWIAVGSVTLGTIASLLRW